MQPFSPWSLPRFPCPRASSRLPGLLHPGALAERLEQVIGFRDFRRCAFRQRLAFELGLDQIGERGLVAIVEFFGRESALLHADDVLGEIEHLALDLGVRNLLEGLLCAPDLVVEVQGRSDQSLVMRSKQNGAHAPEEDRLGDCGDLLLAHAFPKQGKGIRAHLVRCQIIGLVEIDLSTSSQGMNA